MTIMNGSQRTLLSVGVVGFLFVTLGVAVFWSSTAALSILLGLLILFLATKHPLAALAFLGLYFPLEPFLVKWIPEELFLLVRFAPEVLLYLVVAAAFWKRLRTGEQPRTPLDVPFALFLIVLLTSALINLVPPDVSAIGARQILRFVLVFFAVVYLRPDRRALRWFTVAMLIVILLQSALGLSQAFVGEPLDAFLFPEEGRFLGEITLAPNAFRFWDPGSRVFGTLGRYDRLGTFLAFFLLIATGILYEMRQARWRKELWLVFLLGLPALALTYSRSGWFGFVLGFLLIAWVFKRDRRVKLAVGGFLLVAVAYLGVTGLVVNRLVDVPSQTVAERFFEAFSVARWQGEYYGLGRLFWIVNTPLHVIPAAPLFGHGPGTFGGGAVSALRNTSVYNELGLPFGVAGTEGYIDNNWLSLWGETGTLGLVFYLWMIVILFRLSHQLWREGKDEFARAVALGFCGAVVAVSLNAFLASFLEARTLAFYFWGYAGVVVVLAQKEGILRL
ncbi:MAG: hypothetical protein UY82_C0028G0005 [Candidatus Uhrbacteria bacterium GW2011_GWC2_53_7]|uniref:O-antigen ligase-related domain-containing protein n=1 Tax=Candidatus Uhrbacteria bacterium GW2011_GWC2_53_7 TaxID=1618986 RepID=A0A0G2A5C5_9BACT|nr:MAG: hypothetical protein UY79_C0005G0007 [Parcubacteria group bacterium GW2011_GWA2_53_21]KKW36112.1 MAG: hypothetical protein UY82_C0028G0005 [Candidatus Uhrbacteria bacterium GW2011_GWC2_53_7]